MEVGGLVTSSEKFNELINENKEANLKNIKYQTLFIKKCSLSKIM